MPESALLKTECATYWHERVNPNIESKGVLPTLRVSLHAEEEMP